MLTRSLAEPFEVKDGKVPLLAGAYVHVEIAGRGEREGIELPREALRSGAFVWVVNGENRLTKREVEIGWRLREHIAVIGGLTSGERVVVSPLSQPMEGMKVQLLSSATRGNKSDGQVISAAPDGGRK